MRPIRQAVPESVLKKWEFKRLQMLNSKWQTQHVLIMPRHRFEHRFFVDFKRLPMFPGIIDHRDDPVIPLRISNDPLFR